MPLLLLLAMVLLPTLDLPVVLLLLYLEAVALLEVFKLDLPRLSAALEFTLASALPSL